MAKIETTAFDSADYLNTAEAIAAYLDAWLEDGTPEELRRSTDPYVKQFVNAEPDGPVPFHYPGKSLAEDLGLGGKR